MHSTTTLDADVIVLGAGPAGSTLARLLAVDGLSVLLVDQTAGPSFKVGESLLPEGIRLCRKMGLGSVLEERGFIQKHAARFVLCEDGAEDSFPFINALRGEHAPFAYQVKRVEFDSMLQQFAEAGGARIVWNFTAENIEFPPSGNVHITSADGRTRRARYLADATGPGSVLARQFSLREPLPGLGKVALFSHFSNIARAEGQAGGDIIIVWSQTGWFWLIPFSDGSASVGVVGDPSVINSAGAADQERFDQLCEQSDVHRHYLSRRQQKLPIQRRVDFSFRCKSLSGDRYILVGDASGFIDPIFSTGVFLAQKSAFLARDAIAPALLASELPQTAARMHYEQELRRGVGRFLGLVRQFYDASFMDAIIRSRTRVHVKRALTSILAGDVYHEDNILIRLGTFDANKL